MMFFFIEDVPPWTVTFALSWVAIELEGSSLHLCLKQKKTDSVVHMTRNAAKTVTFKK